jgi:hypothetical protein
VIADPKGNYCVLDTSSCRKRAFLRLECLRADRDGPRSEVMVFTEDRSSDTLELPWPTEGWLTLGVIMPAGKDGDMSRRGTTKRMPSAHSVERAIRMSDRS